MTGDRTTELRADALSLGYNGLAVVDELSLSVPPGRMTALVGPNACGKSTLLRGLARLLPARHGTVVLDGREISSYPTRQVALRLGLLPQAATAPEGITVEDLVGRGRYPHQSWLRQWSLEDEAAVERALELTGTLDLRHRPIDELSGGQRQRAWIAMSLAQSTQLMLLDEPTTYLDIAHQIEVLDLLRHLVEEEGRTIVIVLHDLNQACRYADHLVAMRDGKIVAEGPPGEIVTGELVGSVFGIDCRILPEPETGTPLVIPKSRAAAPPAATQPPQKPPGGSLP